MNIYEINSKLPMIKYSDNTTDYITPKISFRINPSDMKDYSSDNRLITTDNIFDINSSFGFNFVLAGDIILFPWAFSVFF